MSATTANVGFIGPGQMGMPMVRRMTTAGIRLKVCARRPEVIAEIQSLGVEVVPTVRDAVEGVDLVIACLFSDVQLADIMVNEKALGAMEPGSIFVSHVTGSPDLIEKLVAIVPQSVTVVDAPVSGTAEQIAEGKLTVMLGCPPQLVAPISAVIGSYANPIVHIGKRGDALKVKLINNLLFTANLILAGETQRLGDALGIDRQLLTDALANCSGATRAVSIIGAKDFSLMESTARPFLEKDVSVVNAIANELGINLGQLGALTAGYNHSSEVIS